MRKDRFREAKKLVESHQKQDENPGFILSPELKHIHTHPHIDTLFHMHIYTHRHTHKVHMHTHLKTHVQRHAPTYAHVHKQPHEYT